MSQIDALVLGYLEARGYRRAAKRLRDESQADSTDMPGPQVLQLFANLVLPPTKRPRESDKASAKPSKKSRVSDEGERLKKFDEKLKILEKKSKKVEIKSGAEKVEKPCKENERAKSVESTDKKAQLSQCFSEDPKAVIARIDAAKVKEVLKKEKFQNFSFASKNGDVFASKAAADLNKFRGKDFRKEMAKKKKASWRGQGTIDVNSVHSVMFSDSD